MRTNTRSNATAMLMAALLAGCSAGGASPSSGPTPDPHAGAVIRGATGDARPDAERYPFTQADTDFMTMMIGHHAQAIVMSELAPERAESQSIRTLAARIINSQRDEIATMQQWLRDREQPVPEVDAAGNVTMPAGEHTGHTGHDMRAGHDPLMPGMLTAEELDELAAASGPEFDRLFLTSMIQHHRGAITMVEELFATHGAGQDEAVFRLASDVNVDQITEISRMQQMLVDLVFESGSR